MVRKKDTNLPVTDIWSILSDSVKAEPQTSSSSIPSVVKKLTTAPKSSFRSRVLSWSYDLFGYMVWLYICTKLFVFDIDRVVIGAVVPYASWLITYKALIFLGFIFLISAAFWRKKALLIILYISVFPLVIIFWKVPNLIVRFRLHKKWVFWMVLLNGIVDLIRNLRYHLGSKSIGIIAVTIVIVSNNVYLIVPAASCLVVILVLSVIRLMKETFSPSWFLQSQTRAIQFFSGAFMKPSLTDVETLIKTSGEKATKEIKILKGQDLMNLSLKIQLGIIATRLIAFWAYKLQQYRQFQIAALLNLASYLNVVFGSLVTLTLTNMTILKLKPEQFNFDGYPSYIAVTLYSVCNFVLSEGGGITAHGDISYAVRIVAGIFGVSFIGVFVLNLMIIARGTKEDIELKVAVEEMRTLAKKQETEFRRIFTVGFDEACQRLVALGLGGLLFISNYIAKSIPTNFLEDVE